MYDEQGERRGLGKVVYDTEPAGSEASKESFSASDSPNYTGRASKEETSIGEATAAAKPPAPFTSTGR